MENPQDIGKALREIAIAIENNEAVDSIVVKINLKKQNHKAKEESN